MKYETDIAELLGIRWWDGSGVGGLLGVLWWQRYALLQRDLLTVMLVDVHVAQKVYEAHQRGNPEDTRQINYMCYKTVEQFVLGRDYMGEQYSMLKQNILFEAEYSQAVEFMHKHNNEWKAEQHGAPLPRAPQAGHSEGGR